MTTHLRRLKSRAPALSCLVAAALAGAACGGGTEVAAPDPEVAGSGLATLSIDGVTYSGTQLVTSGVSGRRDTFPLVTDEPVAIGPAGTGNLARSPVSTGFPITATDAGGGSLAATVGACAGAVDLQVDAPTGRVTACPAGRVMPGDTVLMTYRYVDATYDMRAGITFPEGRQADVTLFNVVLGDTAPFTVNAAAAAAPAGGVKAFRVTVLTGLTGPPAGRKEYRVVEACSAPGAPGCLARNALDVTLLDLSNGVDTCFAGKVTATVSDALDPDPANRSLLVLDFSDPVCP